MGLAGPTRNSLGTRLGPSSWTIQRAGPGQARPDLMAWAKIVGMGPTRARPLPSTNTESFISREISSFLRDFINNSFKTYFLTDNSCFKYDIRN